MVDRADDLRVGIKSTAILFGDADVAIVAALQAATVISLALLGLRLHYGVAYFLGITIAAALFVHQQRLIRGREPARCFAAFRNNVWVGFALFAGTVIELSFPSRSRHQPGQRDASSSTVFHRASSCGCRRHRPSWRACRCGPLSCCWRSCSSASGIWCSENTAYTETTRSPVTSAAWPKRCVRRSANTSSRATPTARRSIASSARWCISARRMRSIRFRSAPNAASTATGYEWIDHSIAPRPKAAVPFRTQIGNAQCGQPYSSSVLNISAMSFGALSAAAIRALNRGAKIDNFAHDTGEGGLSDYHLEAGGDIIWEIGTGYFGCRTNAGGFDAQRFKDRVATNVVKMIEIKLSQGAKPGHGGLLPGAKSPPRSLGCAAFPKRSTVSRRRITRSSIRRVGYSSSLRSCVTSAAAGPWDSSYASATNGNSSASGKAMLASGIYPDFIVIDGKEGGTGAAPVEFADHVGMPRRDALWFAHNALIGCGLREQLKIGVSGKIISGFDIAVAMAMGADWCNSARGFMFALGCLQSQQCHTNRCPGRHRHAGPLASTRARCRRQSRARRELPPSHGGCVDGAGRRIRSRSSVGAATAAHQSARRTAQAQLVVAVALPTRARFSTNAATPSA